MQRYFSINAGGSSSIRCKLYYDQEPRAITRMVVFVHGFGGHKDNGAAEKFAQRVLSKYKRTGIVTFDLPCHGEDVKKKLTLHDCIAYLAHVVAYLQENYPCEALYAYATSFGAYLTLQYLAENGNPFRKIALRCPAVNMYQILTEKILTTQELALLEKGKSVAVGFDRKVPVTREFLSDLQAQDIQALDFLDFSEDMCIIQGTADEIVSCETVWNFSQEQLIEFVSVDGADHRFRPNGTMEQAIKAILAFFAL